MQYRSDGGDKIAPRRRTVANPDRCRTGTRRGLGQIDGTTAKHIAISRELHTGCGDLATAVVNRDSARQALEQGKAGAVDAVRRSGGIAPVAVCRGSAVPDTAAALHHPIVRVASCGTIPEAHVGQGVDQVDLTIDRGLQHGVRTSRHAPQGQAVIGQRP
ncbi:hypothetical protein D3C77_225570 [compost metagenome]